MQYCTMWLRELHQHGKHFHQPLRLQLIYTPLFPFFDFIIWFSEAALVLIWLPSIFFGGQNSKVREDKEGERLLVLWLERNGADTCKEWVRKGKKEGKRRRRKRRKKGETYRRLVSSIHRYSNQNWHHNEHSYREYSDRPGKETLNDRLHMFYDPVFTRHYK